MDGSNDVPCIQIYSNIFKCGRMLQNVAFCKSWCSWCIVNHSDMTWIRKKNGHLGPSMGDAPWPLAVLPRCCCPTCHGWGEPRWRILTTAGTTSAVTVFFSNPKPQSSNIFSKFAVSESLEILRSWRIWSLFAYFEFIFSIVHPSGWCLELQYL